ncbi:5391_t:CDS:2 [Ambispora leptoticha]|uniref:5391_t:CDS:1 n=1 Tax=Ambispora leptoticha TaxID=144679 RepID=A0A9N8WG52_9GLOM|nr:5391_t:CDS:2 [Ambispora leptoticha]
MSSLLGLFTKFSRRTLQPSVFPLLTLQKRARQTNPYDSPSASARILAPSASGFTKRDLEVLQVSFKPADKYDVIPDIKVTNFPEQYLLPYINHDLLINRNFNVENFTEILDDHVKTFVDKLHDVVKNSGLDAGTSESTTDTLVNDLVLHVVNFDTWPFKVRLQPPLKLIARNESVTAEPKFVINKRQIALIGAEIYMFLMLENGFGEWQIAGEILACGYENVIKNYVDQEIFAFRVISTYVTFYRAEISVSYWEALYETLPSRD